MSALEIKGLYIKRYINSSVYFLLFCYVTANDNIISISSMFPVPVAAYTFYLQVSRFSIALYGLGNM